MMNENYNTATAPLNTVGRYDGAEIKRDKSVIEMRSDELAKETENLFVFVNELRDRLKPVLSPKATDGGSPVGDNGDVPRCSPIARCLEYERENIIKTREVIGDIMQRLEL